MDHKQRTHIKDIPLVNEKLYQEVAKANRISPSMCKDIIEHVGHYITKTIKKGQMESVMLPGFGKFKPKIKHLRALHKLTLNKGTNGKEQIFRILNGKPVLDDSIRDRPGEQHGQDEQTLDVPDTGICGTGEEG